ncbi:uncharacterized protein LOC135465558 [Liolophura sinensis]|uniref:uncharacterized protein LOC135465558 n=1 Tax=Liolophura sinensis TaxID=3198878 RepID=UPI0031590AC2
MESFLFDIICAVFGPVVAIIESIFLRLVVWYDDYIYSPLQRLISPVVARIPRHVAFENSKYTIFTANIVSCTRTSLTVPIVWLVKYDYCWAAFSLVLLHDFLDHVDGIVAKVQRRLYGAVDDPLLGGFMDAFCDKIVNVTCLWSLLLLTDYRGMTLRQIAFYIGACAIIIIYEFILGVVRVQDYFSAYFARKYGKSVATVQLSSTAIMEGKLKEKLESLGIAFLCLSQASNVVMDTYSGIAGVTCLLLSVRLAHASLQQKLNIRKMHTASNQDTSEKPNHTKKSYSDAVKEDKYEVKPHTQDSKDIPTEEESKGRNSDKPKLNISQRLKDFPQETKAAFNIERALGLPKRNGNTDGRVDKVYTIGCFDLFHFGHVILLRRMKSLGKQVIVGVHDNKSIQQLKNRVPIDDTEKRMTNVKKYADEVFCVASPNPTTFLRCMFNQTKNQSCLYVRGDDMPNFPARSLCEAYMPIHFLPYTAGVSSTSLREVFLKRKHEVKNNKFEEDDYSLFY